MAPSPQESGVFNASPSNAFSEMTGEEIVISGISGVFPESVNIMEFMKNLYDKVDMVSPAVLDYTHPDFPKFQGNIQGLEKFDAKFFKVTRLQCESLEPTCRKGMEQTYNCIYDAGINPIEFRGKKIGVFSCAMYCDSGKLTSCDALKNNGFLVSGGSKNMIANRVSYSLDMKGPSYTIENSCSGSFVCFEHAYHCIKAGICEAVVVEGCQNCNHPVMTVNMRNAGLLNIDGKTKCFDKNGDGYARAEAVTTIFLQKSKDAKRIYAELLAADNQYDLNNDGTFRPYRTLEQIEGFLNKFYLDKGISPNDVEYVEAYGAAHPDSDANELQAIANVFAKNTPVMVGCLKSNMGNSEPASGNCALIKLCLAYHKGKLPANLHYNNPLDISAVQEGKVQILTDNAPFERGLTAINNFSFTGLNSHAVFKGHYKPKDLARYECNIPRLVCLYGRHDGAVKNIIKRLSSQPIDPELIGMLHNIYKVETSEFTYRGYTLLDINDKKETVSLTEAIEIYQGAKPPLWLVYTGMGSQWAGMGADLMRIPIFADAIEKCRKVLEPKGVDIVHIITSPDKTIFDNIMNCFVGIAAVQIGLTDVLKAIGIVPDNIIGHSVGELGCAYFDGCFTTEEMILSAYARGLVSVQTELIKGSMAAVGIGYEELRPFCPPEVDIACHNSAESCTISGPTDVLKVFVGELKGKGIFAKEVPCGNIAYHSRYIQKAGPNFLKKLSEVIKKPVQRSSKWLPTSLPEERWKDPIAKFSSPEYHANNLLSPVYFEETARKIPAGAVVVEVAPHGLLQAILKRSHPECLHIPLTRRGNAHPLRFLLDSFGKIFTSGYCLALDVLYPKIEYPVSTETPPISHFVEWYHEEEWLVPRTGKQERIQSCIRNINLSLQDDDFEFIKGNVIEGIVVLPEAAVLFLVWETLAMFHEMSYEDLSIEFENVQFHGDIIMDSNIAVKLKCSISRVKENKYFEVTRDDDDAMFASGYINSRKKNQVLNNENQENHEITESKHNQLGKEDIYKFLTSKGYGYQKNFKSILSCSWQWDSAQIKWTGNWITFLDSLIQFNILARNHDGISVPKMFRKVIIDVDNIKGINTKIDDNSSLTAERDIFNGHTKCAGVELVNIIFEDKAPIETIPDVIHTVEFIPHDYREPLEMYKALLINLQIVHENIVEDVLKISEIASDSGTKLTNTIEVLSDYLPEVYFDTKVISTEDKECYATTHLFIGNNLFKNKQLIEEIYKNTRNYVFVLSVEDRKSSLMSYVNFNIITTLNVEGKTMALLNKVTEQAVPRFIMIKQYMEQSWLENLIQDLKSKNEKVILVADRQPRCGMIGLVKNLRKEFKNKIGLVSIEDHQSRQFHPKLDDYAMQLEKKLAFNVLRRGHWGGCYALPMSKSMPAAVFNLTITESGNINSLKWTETQRDHIDDDLIQVSCAGPTLKDVEKTVSTQGTEKIDFGMDFSGVDSRGNKVMGLLAAGSLATCVKPDPDLLWPVPDYWTLEEAATVPLPYAHAFYCLVLRGELLPRKSVFVSGGAGALGQAVISICLALGCSVYTTVSNVNKKRFLMKLFPQLNENNIGYSYDNSFYSLVLINSEGKGCNFVISCASSPMREVLMKCVANQGIFYDINTYDMKMNKDFGMSFAVGERNYRAVNFSNIFKLENAHEKKLIREIISEGIADGIVRPITNVTYVPDDVPRAFRLLSHNQNRGRVLIKIGGIANNIVKAIPRIEVSPQDTFLIVCDETDLGIELANRLVCRGAKNLMFNIKSVASTYLQVKIMMWQKIGVSVTISLEDLYLEENCNKMFKKAKHVSGIFIIQPLASEKTYKYKTLFENAHAVTTLVSNINIISRINCPELRNFVVLSRVSQNVVDEYTAVILEKICISNLKVPTLMMRFEFLDIDECQAEQSIDRRMRSQTMRTAFTALEISIKQKIKTVVTYDINKKRFDFMKELADILGISTIRDINDNVTVHQLNFSDSKIEELQLFIKKVYKIEYPQEFIKNMTISSIKNINIINAHNIKFDAGFGAIYNYIDLDEIRATEQFALMRTMISRYEGEETINADETFVILIPGFEGHHQIFYATCERMKIPAMTCLLGPDFCNDSIPEMARIIKQRLVTKYDMRDKFYILGYSFGVNIALEIASLLEQDGRVGVVFCLDSSPDAVKVHLDAYLGKLSDNELQNAIIEHLFYVMSGKRGNLQLENLKDWNEKVDECSSQLKDLVSNTTEYKKAILDTVYKRILLAKNYKPELNLESQIVLMKGIPNPKAESLPFDYGLSKYAKNPIKIYDLMSDMAMAPADCRVPNIVNKYLDPTLLKEFKKKNLCEMYTIGSGF